MNAIADYFAVIDAIAVLALIALAVAAVVRQGSLLMGVLTGAVALWAAIRLFGIV
jgi:hypothetical protein